MKALIAVNAGRRSVAHHRRRSEGKPLGVRGTYEALAPGWAPFSIKRQMRKRGGSLAMKHVPHRHRVSGYTTHKGKRVRSYTRS